MVWDFLISITKQISGILFSLLYTHGYLGVLIASFVGSSTIILPLPGAAVIFAAGGFLDPFWVGVFGALGSMLGELIGYVLGLGGRKVIDRRFKKDVTRWEKAFKKHGGFAIIILFAATPLPDDIVGIIGGALKYPIGKFMLASFIGKLILSLVLSYAGFYGVNWIL